MQYLPSLNSFLGEYEKGQSQVIWTHIVSDLETPVSAMMKLAENEPNSFLFESVEGGAVRGRYSIIGFRPDVIWKCHGNEASINRSALEDADTGFSPCTEPPLIALRSLLAESRIDLPEDLPPMAAGVFGYMGYDMVRLMEDLPQANPDILEVPDAIFLRPTVMVIFDAVKDQMSIVTPVFPSQDVSGPQAYEDALKRLEQASATLGGALGRTDGRSADEIMVSEAPASNTSAEEYEAMVEKAKEYIAAGDVFQVVLSQRFETPFALPPFSLYRALRRLNPSPFLYHLNFGEFCVIGSSPEILVRARDGEVTIRPIAGTRPRGETQAEDKAFAQDLLSDPKELAEHLMLLDLGRNDVGRVSKPGTVTVTDQFMLEYYSAVMHIVSNVVGDMSDDYDALSALEAGFPAGTVSGAPKVRAMEIIDELEKHKRSVYAGCVGYFSASGEMDTCIVLRTAIVKDGVMYVQAGAGIVADSVPSSEQMECINKAKALFRAAEEAVRFSGRGKNNGQDAS